MPAVSFQPIFSEDVASALTDVAAGAPANGIVEAAGKERMRFDMLVQLFLTAKGDPRQVVANNNARYFGSVLEDKSLVLEDDSSAIVAPTRFTYWVAAKE